MALSTDKTIRASKGIDGLIRVGGPVNLKLGQILLNQGGINEEQLAYALERHQETGKEIGRVLIDLGICEERDICLGMAEQLGIPYVELSQVDPDPAVLDEVPARCAMHFRFLPVGRDGERLQIAVSDPQNFSKMDEIHLALHKPVEAAIAPESEIMAALSRCYGVGAETLEQMMDGTDTVQGVEAEQSAAARDLESDVGDATLGRVVDQILLQALRERATDIHFEPFEDEFRVRFRVDGILRTASIPKDLRQFQPAVVSRLKVMAELNIAEKRLPQDGRIRIRVGDEELDLRVSVLPTEAGEAVNLRILSRRNILMDMGELGLNDEGLAVFEGLIQKPHGVALLTGPTGSGKTTTLYSCLNRLNGLERKIITVEDPVEYRLKGIVQIEVHPSIGLDFARGLRSILRHDPDVIMVGEIRDTETAEIAIRSALTGHLVFSTLHTNDAAGAVTRLADMGIEPYLVASCLEASIAQRLVRRICPKCREETDLSASERVFVSDHGGEESAEGPFYAGVGCESCRFTGYRGRTAIYEFFVPDEEVRELIVRNEPTRRLRQAAIEHGMRLLLHDGLEKVSDGLTTVSEVLRVAGAA